jgi:predicted nucleic acid-binding protein
MKENRSCRVFLDANILFSAAYGSPAMKRLWSAAENGTFIFLASPYVIEEARRNLDTKDQHTALDSCLEHVQIVLEVDRDIPCPIDLPEKDKPVFLAAVTAGADYLVTGDILHFGPFFGRKIQGVTICRPRDLFELNQAELREKDS